MEPAWVALNSSTQAPPPWTTVSCWHRTEIGASSISLFSNLLQESEFWCHPGVPVHTGAVVAPREGEGAGSAAKPAASTQHGLAFFQHSCIVLRGASHCLRTVPLAGLSAPICFIRKTTFRASFPPKLVVPPPALSCTGEAGVSRDRNAVPAVSSTAEVMLWDTA